VTLATILTTFAVIFLAELPDKSLFASLVLGTRFHPFAVWLGVAAAFAIHVVLAVAVGGALSLLPGRLVDGVTAVLFAAGAVVLLRPRRHDGDDEDDEDGQEGGARGDGDRPATFPYAVLASFGLVFIGEWGDLTQIATANLAASSADPLSVGVGALAALWTVAALAIGAGRGLLRLVPLRLVRRAAGVVFLALAVLTAVDAVRG
jgi:putative Ca2+/H+ antiporter (TMEM165/GDT1 family)